MVFFFFFFLQNNDRNKIFELYSFFNHLHDFFPNSGNIEGELSNPWRLFIYYGKLFVI